MVPNPATPWMLVSLLDMRFVLPMLLGDCQKSVAIAAMALPIHVKALGPMGLALLANTHVRVVTLPQFKIYVLP